MKIWVDADACPVAIKNVLFRAAERWQVPLILVANRGMSCPPSPWIKAMQVEAGFDKADQFIVERVAKGELVISADIPLAYEVLSQGGEVIDPRGERYTLANIKARLTLRDFMESLRSSGVQTGGPTPHHARDTKAFADQLDRFLAKH
ncbi:MAG: YaiI/YqxD family protein [Thiomicrospira sp.]